MRQDRAGHDFDGVITARKFERWRARALSGLNLESALAAPQQFAVDRDTVHGHAVVGRRVALGINILAQCPTDTLRQWQ